MLTKLKPTIAIIDSGIGGVSVLKQLVKKFNAGNYIYYADNLYMPYGRLSHSFLQNRLDYIINMLNSNYKVDIIIIACNTASSVLINNNYPNVVTINFNKADIYFATPLTHKCLSGYKVLSDNTLAKLIEKYIFNTKKMDGIIKNHVKKYKLNQLDKFVLGCTHYELVLDLFKKYCPSTQVCTNTENLVDKLKFSPMCNDLTIYYILSKQDQTYVEKLQELVRR